MDRHVVLMDAGIPMSQRFETYADEQLGRYLILSVGIAQPGDIVVWPEAPINVIWRNSGGTARGIIEMPDALDAIANTLSRQILITGSPQFTTGSSQFNSGETGKYYNTLAVFNGEIANYGFSAVYYKHRLVPLGELAAVDIVPFGRRISAILPKALQQMAEGGYSPGSGPGIITMQSLPSFVPLVCYEVLFPQVSRAHALEAAWLVNISLDGWFGSGIGPQQHYAQARFRAIETGLPLARAASRGVTAMVDPFGRETARGAVQAGDPKGWRSSVVRTPMPVKLDPTPYLRFGSAFFWMTLVMLAGLAVITWRR